MIVVKKEDNLITIKGHANYSDKEDIVCASVSSIMYTTVNAILRFDENALKYEDSGDEVLITINKSTEASDKLIFNMMSLFNELALKYPNNIKIESEE